MRVMPNTQFNFPKPSIECAGVSFRELANHWSEAMIDRCLRGSAGKPRTTQGTRRDVRRPPFGSPMMLCELYRNLYGKMPRRREVFRVSVGYASATRPTSIDLRTPCLSRNVIQRTGSFIQIVRK
jgi:hypothetical protein